MQVSKYDFFSLRLKTLYCNKLSLAVTQDIYLLLNFDLDRKYQIHLDEKTNKRDAILTMFLAI